MATIKQRLYRKNSAGSYDTVHLETSADLLVGAVPVTKGGTGATTATAARSNLGITPANIGAAASSHNHAASNITSGTLGVARGGTGVTSNPSMLVNLSSTAAASVFAASPRPGVTGTLPVSRGGTGATTADAARRALQVMYNDYPSRTAYENADFDDITTNGFYRMLYQKGTAQSVYHTPYAQYTSGYKTVTHYNLLVMGMPTRLTQIAISAYSHNDDAVFVRNKHDSTWSAWRRLYTDAQTIPVANGGTGATSAAAARTNLGAAATSHTHTIAQVTNLQTTLNGKAPTSHTHTIANITNLQSEIDSLKTSVSEGKGLIASAITDAGGSASSSASFSALAQAIRMMSLSMWYEQTITLTANGTQTQTIQVADPNVWFIYYADSLSNDTSFICRIDKFYLYAIGGSNSRSRVYCENYPPASSYMGADIKGTTLTLYGPNVTSYHIWMNRPHILRYCKM